MPEQGIALFCREVCAGDIEPAALAAALKALAGLLKAASKWQQRDMLKMLAVCPMADPWKPATDHRCQVCALAQPALELWMSHAVSADHWLRCCLG